MSAWFDYVATLKILVFALLVGGALPALFALGVRMGAPNGPNADGTTRRNPVMVALSWLVFALVVAAVVVGVLFIARDFLAHRFGWHLLGAYPVGAGT
ncbi:hypothetical protein H7J07_08450 [Mycobacterium koreense]|uniref:Uncharacterized protein n=1 Tax=Mycolicibacillus koreensis TaxID=1069220 RepID=A0A7I7SGY1_9MYCO|nr:hypothetical protein [Mycolicibacillus koreensis]MCV7248248.1 hypothetical protein [Mycolicibacillus koreensis]ODR09565.1 hypothetical protein BHQ15_06710 [Mycolicibacillus koreensis]OSC33856.1 hypothetical protein B8W67_09260 [Mycolicibacillus koreensis]BBY55186.1 hypothetical protein MKOR_24370 [Mycolicibacillus koreensis]